MKCLICKKPLEEHPPRKSEFFPFCSERCKLIDLGRWLNGRYQIPVDDEPPHDSDTLTRSDELE